jgi:hypothetical protein
VTATRLIIVAAILAGLTIGIGAYTFLYAKGLLPDERRALARRIQISKGLLHLAGRCELHEPSACARCKRVP